MSGDADVIVQKLSQTRNPTVNDHGHVLPADQHQKPAYQTCDNEGDDLIGEKTGYEYSHGQKKGSQQYSAEIAADDRSEIGPSQENQKDGNGERSGQSDEIKDKTRQEFTQDNKFRFHRQGEQQFDGAEFIFLRP